MNKGLLIISLGLICITATAQVDLKTYYEQQKAAITPTFSAPELGSQITVELAGGQSRTGVLMKLDTASVTVMADTGSMISYKRNALKESSRAFLFAEDFAHIKALEKTKIYKEQQLDECQAEKEAGMHEGSLSVTAKTSKESDTDKKVEERENKSRGEKLSFTTTTKTAKETQKLSVTVTNQTGHPDKFTIEYYFVGKTVSKGGNNNKNTKAKPSEGGALKIHDSGTRPVTVEGRGREKLDLSSKVFEVTKVSVSSNSYGGDSAPPKESGIESAGYLVVLKYGSTVLDKKASARTYLADDWLRQMK